MYKNLIIELAKVIRAAVKPNLKNINAGNIANIAATGDLTFKIDQIAEDKVKSYLQNIPLKVAYYTEDRGLVGEKSSDFILIIDPIDGSRSAMCNFESCVVSIAMAKNKVNPTIGDVIYACIYEIKNDTYFWAERNRGIEIVSNNKKIKLRRRSNSSLQHLRWSVELMGRPTNIIFRFLGELANLSSVYGGIFVFNSACYSITRLLTGQLDAYIDLGIRIVEEFPNMMTKSFKIAGAGKLRGLYPHDLAAAVLLCEEAGCPITTAFRENMNDLALLDYSETNLSSCIATNNKITHQAILNHIESKLRKFRKDET